MRKGVVVCCGVWKCSYDPARAGSWVCPGCGLLHAWEAQR
jgi:hypothetical protein